MGRKPSLTLELDSHTADAGLETRVEAFLDIVQAYRQLVANNQIAAKNKTFVPARTALRSGGLHAQSPARSGAVAGELGKPEAHASSFRKRT